MAHPAIDLCLDGQISPAVTLARLVFDGVSIDRIEGMLPEGSALAEFFALYRGRLDALTRMIAQSGTSHDVAGPNGEDEVASIAAMFDRAVALAPEASVAAYSLGDAGLLAVATDELVTWLLAQGLCGPRSGILDLGCGIGRVAAALAPHVGTVLGLDVSPGMIDEAGRRHRAPNLSFELTDGSPIQHLPASSFDLVLAVDSMPYLVQAGIAAAHVAAAAQLLRPGGSIVICNLSYRSATADAETAEAWARSLKLDLTLCGARPFRFWDGAVFVLKSSA